VEANELGDSDLANASVIGIEIARSEPHLAIRPGGEAINFIESRERK
jgi:hypothetical protein